MLPERRAVLLHRLVRHHCGVRQRCKPREHVERLLQRDGNCPRVGGLDFVDVVHRPHAARRVRGVAQAIERIHHVLRGRQPALPVGEAGVVLEAHAVAQTVGVHETVRAHHGKVARTRPETVWARLVVDLQQRLVNERGRAGVVHGGRVDGIHRGHALQRATERDAAGRVGRQQQQGDSYSSHFSFSASDFSSTTPPQSSARPCRRLRPRRRTGRPTPCGCCGRCNVQSAA